MKRNSATRAQRSERSGERCLGGMNSNSTYPRLRLPGFRFGTRSTGGGVTRARRRSSSAVQSVAGIRGSGDRFRRRVTVRMPSAYLAPCASCHGRGA